MSAPVSAHLEQTLPPAYKGHRGEILMALKRETALTARELSERLALSANATRHHLRELESDGLIDHRREQRGLGAPTYAWHLTAMGEALFPQRYKETLTHMLDAVARLAGRDAVVEALESYYHEQASRLEQSLIGATPEERMRLLAEARTQDGYMAEGRASFCCGTLTEHHCAIRAVAERYPEVCDAEARYVGRLLGGQVERRLHVLNGASACEYQVLFPTAGMDTQEGA
jgi:DeoR family transcriptional regulator, suf operon transcriptional repressor